MQNNAQVLQDETSRPFGTNYSMLVLNKLHKVSQIHMMKYISLNSIQLLNWNQIELN
jgi:hypothetical protein